MKENGKNNSRLLLVNREFNGKQYEFLKLISDCADGSSIEFLVDLRVCDKKRKAKLFYKIKKSVVGLYE